MINGTRLRSNEKVKNDRIAVEANPSRQEDTPCEFHSAVFHFHLHQLPCHHANHLQILYTDSDSPWVRLPILAPTLRYGHPASWENTEARYFLKWRPCTNTFSLVTCILVPHLGLYLTRLTDASSLCEGAAVIRTDFIQTLPISRTLISTRQHFRSACC